MTEADPGWQIILKGLARYQAACRKAGFNSAQPRVPAGNPDGGQWTSAGVGSAAGSAAGDISDKGDISDTGGGINDPRILSDATPDNVWIPGAQYAQNDEQGYPIDLSEEQTLGGHTIERHVGKSPEFLLTRLQREMAATAERGDFSEGMRMGSFRSLEAATKLVSSTIAQNQDKVERVVSGVSGRESLDAYFGSVTGIEAYARNERSQACLRVIAQRYFESDGGRRRL